MSTADSRPATSGTKPRPNFRTLKDVLLETARLLLESGNHLRSFAPATTDDARRSQVLNTLAEARTRAGQQLEQYAHDTQNEETGLWVQYGSLFDLAPRFDAAIAEVGGEAEAWQLVVQLDEELAGALSDMATTHTPPLEACEKSAALIVHLKRTSSAIMNSALDV